MTDDDKKVKKISEDNNFDRVFIGKPGCMSVIVIIAIAFILYALFIAK
ncbi:hypothetical protein M3N64_08405 [Sporolactobacillus sp. CPB3-1]|uniref:Uncharacterized protein n=1 Tax=Sporolactobacillus mangiferae TaxID=2940498 RepID=A0ABT0MCH0_9BACL|nr:hypothetical protein [Sporolactobacillus mangiferae]MCL1631969.1 hypothetical protein [Sporolactobacillus mangiferae]